MTIAMNVADSFVFDAWARLVIMSTAICLGLMSGALSYAQEVGVKPGQRGGMPPVQLSSSTQAYQRLLDSAEVLVKDGKPADAYTMLEPIEFEHAGEARFDYLIGIAALDSGKPDRATLALERALAVNPDFTAARLDIARAYFQLGDLPRARTEFIAILSQDPATTARANIEKYLALIDEQESGKKLHASGYVVTSAGHDSNVNDSTSQSQIFVDYYAANYPLDPASIQASDNYLAVGTGGELTYELDANWRVYAGADLRQRVNSTQKNFDTINLNGRYGVMFNTQIDRLRFGLLGGRYALGGSHYSDTAGADAEWSHTFSPSNQLKVFGRYAKYRYVDVVMQVNDYDQQALGVGWSHVTADGRSTLFGSAYRGTEKDVSTITILPAMPDGGRTDGAKRFSGLRAGGQRAVGENATLFAYAGAQVGEYGKVNYWFQRQRSDRLYDAGLGASWQWRDRWMLHPQLNYTKNDSNIAIYGYSRMDISLTIRRDFR